MRTTIVVMNQELEEKIRQPMKRNHPLDIPIPSKTKIIMALAKEIAIINHRTLILPDTQETVRDKTKVTIYTMQLASQRTKMIVVKMDTSEDKGRARTISLKTAVDRAVLTITVVTQDQEERDFTDKL